jgi:hypothetical protein
VLKASDEFQLLTHLSGEAMFTLSQQQGK